MSSDRDRVEKCQAGYMQFGEDIEMVRKDNKVINDFLSTLPEAAHSLELDDLDRIYKIEEAKLDHKVTMLKDFADKVKRECVMN